MASKSIDISTNTIWRIIFIALLLAFFYLIRDILVLLFFSIIIASAVDLLARHFDKIKIPRIISVLIIYLVTVGLLVGLLVVFIPSLAKEIKAFSGEFPDYADKLYQKFQSLQSGSLKYQKVISEIQKILASIGESLRESATAILSKTFNIFGGLASIAIIVVISFYLSVQKNGIRNFLRIITPKKHESYVLNLWKRAQLKMGKWFQGQLLLGVIVGALVYLGLWILNVRFALLLAIIAGLLELVPYIGPVLAAIPGVILALFQGPFLLAVWVALMYIAVQQLENYLIAPLVMKKAVGLNPVVVIMVLLIGGKLAGIIGILLAVPTAAVLAEFFRDVKRK